MPKNGYRPVEVNPYAQQRYTSYYIPPVYSPQQQFPLYSLITPQAWSTTHSFIDPTLVGAALRVLLGGGGVLLGGSVAFCCLKPPPPTRWRPSTTTSSSTGSRHTASSQPRPPWRSGITPPGTGTAPPLVEVQF